MGLLFCIFVKQKKNIDSTDLHELLLLANTKVQNEQNVLITQLQRLYLLMSMNILGVFKFKLDIQITFSQSSWLGSE